jgi:hypothetical protein
VSQRKWLPQPAAVSSLVNDMKNYQEGPEGANGTEICDKMGFGLLGMGMKDTKMGMGKPKYHYKDSCGWTFESELFD